MEDVLGVENGNIGSSSGSFFGSNGMSPSFRKQRALAVKKLQRKIARIVKNQKKGKKLSQKKSRKLSKKSKKTVLRKLDLHDSSHDEQQMPQCSANGAHGHVINLDYHMPSVQAMGDQSILNKILRENFHSGVLGAYSSEMTMKNVMMYQQGVSTVMATPGGDAGSLNQYMVPGGASGIVLAHRNDTGMNVDAAFPAVEAFSENDTMSAFAYLRDDEKRFLYDQLVEYASHIVHTPEKNNTGMNMSHNHPDYGHHPARDDYEYAVDSTGNLPTDDLRWVATYICDGNTYCMEEFIQQFDIEPCQFSKSAQEIGRMCMTELFVKENSTSYTRTAATVKEVFEQVMGMDVPHDWYERPATLTSEWLGRGYEYDVGGEFVEIGYVIRYRSRRVSSTFLMSAGRVVAQRGDEGPPARPVQRR